MIYKQGIGSTNSYRQKVENCIKKRKEKYDLSLKSDSKKPKPSFEFLIEKHDLKATSCLQLCS